MTQHSLKQFIKDNSTLPGIEADLIIPFYYFSLDDAFYRYFRTYRDIKHGYNYRINFELWNSNDREIESFNPENTILAILGFHRYFELFIKDLLNRVHSNLSLKISSAANLFEFINNTDLTNTQTIEFKEAFERIKIALKTLDDQNDYAYSTIKNFSFLVSGDNIETLEILNDWRNSIMHYGNSVPNIIALDYLVCRRIIPLIYKIINTDIPDLYKPYYLKTPTGIDILNQVLKIKFNYTDFYNPQKQKSAYKALLNIAHIKELGRASYNVDIDLRQGYHYDNPWESDYMDKFEGLAKQQIKNSNFVKIDTCFCCGNKTMVIYKFKSEQTFEYKFQLKCYFCDYSIYDNIGEPFDFGITKEKYFK